MNEGLLELNKPMSSSMLNAKENSSAAASRTNRANKIYLSSFSIFRK